MKILNQLKAARHVGKLRSARSLAPEALAEVQEQLVQMGPGAIPAVLECLSHGEARDAAMEILLRLLSDDTLDIYLEALGSTNPAVVTGVTKVLAKGHGYDVSRIVGLLADPTLSKPNLESILWEQIDSLAPRRLIGLVPELGKEARAVIFRLLEKTADETILPDLVTLVDHEEWWIRLYVAKLFGEFDEPSSIKGLSRLLQDSHKSVRLEAVAGVRKLRAREAVPSLATRLRDTDLKVQTAAIDALVDICDHTAVPHLLEVLKDESEYARRAAVEVLNEVATAEAIQDLVRALRDEDWWVRVRAADALGTLGGPKVVDGVVALLADSDDFIRRYAVEILNAVPSERAVEPLIRALRDDDWWVRERSIDALAKTGDSRAVEPLLDLLHVDATAAPHCVRALGILGDVKAVPKLVELVNSDSDEIQREAMDALLAFSRLELDPADRLLVNGALGRRDLHPEKGAGSRRGREMEVFGPEAVRTDSARDRTPSETRTPGGATPSPSGASDGSTRSGSGPGAGPATPSGDGSPAGSSLNFYKLPRDTVLAERFRVIRQIGKGGFGAIYLVEDSAIQDELILKILNPQFSLDETAARRFVQELKLTRKITHPNVIRIYDFLDLGGARAVSMEYFPGRDLGQILQSTGPLPTARVCPIMIQACRGLAAAHAESVIHRDIKPANILVGENDTVKIVDFGLASIERQVGSRLTKSGLLIGTPEYMAPELITGNEVDHRADLYSLGIVIYEMLAGRKPFTAETPVKVLFLHLEGEAERLDTLAPDTPAELVALVHRCISKEPDDRPADSGELLKALESITGSGTAEAA